MKARPGKGQLTLIPYKPDWKLSATTKEIGFQGLAKARNTLAQHEPQEGKVQEVNPFPASREFPIDATIKDAPPRVAIHDDWVSGGNSLMRDLIIGGKIKGTLFQFLDNVPTISSTSHPNTPSGIANWQEVGFAACFMN